MRLYSDDFGLNKKVDLAIIKLVRKGKLFGLSVLPNLAHKASLNLLADVLPHGDKFILGSHINLVEGYPIQSPDKVRTLIGKNDKFNTLPFFLLKLFTGSLKKAHIRREIESQISLLKAKGFKIKILDSHQHTHAFSPVAEIMVETAKKLRIREIRGYDRIKFYSPKARFTYAIVKVLAFLSYLFAYKKVGMPATWKLKQKVIWTVMSWEDSTLQADEVRNKNSAFVIHPYLPYDSNRSYLEFIK